MENPTTYLKWGKTGGKIRSKEFGGFEATFVEIELRQCTLDLGKIDSFVCFLSSMSHRCILLIRWVVPLGTKSI